MPRIQPPGAQLQNSRDAMDYDLRLYAFRRRNKCLSELHACCLRRRPTHNNRNARQGAPLLPLPPKTYHTTL